MDMKSQIEKKRASNPYIHSVLCMKERHGYTYEQALEMMVIVLAERADALEQLLVAKAYGMPTFH